MKRNSEPEKTLLERLQLEKSQERKRAGHTRAERSQGHMHGDQDAWEFLRREKLRRRPLLLPRRIKMLRVMQ